MATVQRHRTAMGRTGLSRPMQLALATGLVGDHTTVMDYGCGRGDDIRTLNGLGIDCVGWDPKHLANGQRRESEVVNLGYVVNVIEDPSERAGTLRSAWALARRALIVAARVDIQAAPESAEEHADGILTSRGTFQKFYTQAELRSWIDSVLNCRSLAAGPGIFFILRKEEERQRYASRLVRRRLSVPTGRVSETLFEQHRDILDPLVEFFIERGRLPADEELHTATQLVAAFGSIPRAFRAVRSVSATDQWHEIEDARRDDLLVYLALEKFGRRARFSQLPQELQRDIKALFGTYKRACAEADELLYSAGDAGSVGRACAQAAVGKVTPEALYVHKDAVSSLAPQLRVFEGCARVLVGDAEGANIVKLDRARPKVSYLSYPDFNKVAHPPLATSIVVWLDSLVARFYDFRDRTNPPILHRKETLVPPDYPRRDLFARLTRQEERRGLLDQPDIGTLRGWTELLADRQFKVAGHTLRRI